MASLYKRLRFARIVYSRTASITVLSYASAIVIGISFSS